MEQRRGAVARPGRGPAWDVVAVVAAGGALGGVLRYALGRAVPVAPEGFPWATFVENVLGCFLLAGLLVLLLEVWPPRRYARPFLGVGLLGGFTTFSAFTAETRGLLAGGAAPLALAYVLGTVFAGLAATWGGLALVRRLTAPPVS